MDLYDDNDMDYSCESFMDFCDRMMIADEGFAKAYVVTIAEMFKTVFNAIQRLLNNVRRLQTIVMPKKLIGSYNKLIAESGRIIEAAGGGNSTGALAAESGYEKLSQSKEYEEIINFDGSKLKPTDYGKFNSNVIVNSMNFDLKYMQKYKMIANIKEANDDRGMFGKGAGNAQIYRALQKIHMMRYKIYTKVCSFKIPGEYDKNNLAKYETLAESNK